MANNTDIVKEIEEAEQNVVYVTKACHDEIAYATEKDKRVWIECCDKLRKAELALQRAREALTGQAHRDEQLSKNIDTAMHTVARAKGILKGEGFYIAGDELDSVLLTLDEAKHKYTPEEK